MSSERRVSPRGNALTATEELTAPNAVEWIAYIEGLPLERPRTLLSRTVLPPRRLRFDSAGESRVSPDLPAGSPFLSRARLLALLAASRPIPAPDAPARFGKRRVRIRSFVTASKAIVTKTHEAAGHTMDLAIEALHGLRARS